MMNEKQAKKWEKLRKANYLRIAISMLIFVPLMMLTTYISNYIIDGQTLSKTELDAKIPMVLSVTYWMTFILLIYSHRAEKKYQNYLEANKAGKK